MLLFLAMTAPATAGSLPDVSPARLATVTGQVRQNWQADAYPVMVTITTLGNGNYATSMNYISPSTNAGLTVLFFPGGVQNLPTAAPNWGTKAIPDTFLSLNDLFVAAGMQPDQVQISNAELYWSSRQLQPDVLMWSFSLADGQTGNVPAAHSMPSQEK